MPQSNLQSYQLLLQVFNRGLISGFVSKDEVVNWADGIIKTEAEPGHFFIELSLAKNVNAMIEILGSTNLLNGAHPIVSRVLLSLLYQELVAGKIEIGKVYAYISNISMERCVTKLEWTQMIDLDDEFDERFGLPTAVELPSLALRFLSVYKQFSINNFDQWQAINTVIEAHFLS